MKHYALLSIVMFHGATSFAAVTTQLTTRPFNAQDILAQLTLDQKIGQLFMVAAVSDEQANASFMATQPHIKRKTEIEQLIQQYHIGGILFMNGTVEQQREQTQEYQQLSRVPLLIAQDLEWGLSMRLKDTLRFPRNMTLGAVQNDELIYALGKEIGRQARLLGIHMNMAPVVDVNNNPNNPIIHDRSFGDNPEMGARKGILFMQGLRDAGIIACAKHFPGHGDTTVDSHSDSPRIEHSLDRLHALELHPFKELIDAGVPAIMLAHLEVPALEHQAGLPASLSYNVATRLLQEQLKFNGLVVVDSLGMHAITNRWNPGEVEVMAFRAGVDILLCPLDVPKAVACFKQALADGRISMQELDARVLKILRAKEWVYMQHNQQEPTLTPDQLHTTVAYALKKQLYQEAITLARNQNAIIPLSANTTSIAYLQIGGQQESQFKQTLQKTLAVSAHYISSTPNNKELEVVDNQLANANTVIIALFDIIAFRPMNKRLEETSTTINYGIADSTRDYIQQLQQQGKTVILVLFGTPYSMRLFPAMPTVIVAYENDDDAQEAAAEVVVGMRKATGKLPVKV
jgi:beta-N-acetylhexosaminidase